MIKKIFIIITISIALSISCMIEFVNPFLKTNRKEEDVIRLNKNPTIVIRQGATSIPSDTGIYPFGDVEMGQSSSNVNFTIENRGAKKLLLIGTPLIDITGDIADFIITQPSKNDLDPLETVNFSIRLNPSNMSVKNAVISINSNDLSNDMYEFSLTGNVPGSLSYVDHFARNEIRFSSDFVFSAGYQNIYACNRSIDRIVQFDRNTSNGNVIYFNQYTVAGEGPESAVVTPDDTKVFITYYTTGAVAWFWRDASGDLTYGGRIDGIGMDHPYAVAVSSDGQNVYTTDYETKAIYWFWWDVSSDSLKYADNYSNATYLDQPNQILISNDGMHVYVVSFNSDSIAWFTRSSDPSGDLTFQGAYSDPNIDGANRAFISPDGKLVYVAAGLADSIAWFDRDTGDGSLQYVDRYTSSADLDGVRDIAITADNKYLYAPCGLGQNLSWFRRYSDPSGDIVYGGKNQPSFLKEAKSIMISPDNEYIYILSYDSDASEGIISWYSINR